MNYYSIVVCHINNNILRDNIILSLAVFIVLPKNILLYDNNNIGIPGNTVHNIIIVLGRSPPRYTVVVFDTRLFLGIVKHASILLFFIRLSSSRFSLSVSPSLSLPRMHPCRHLSNVVEKYCKPHGTTSGPYKMRSCIDFGRSLFHSNHPSRLTLATYTTSLSYPGAIYNVLCIYARISSAVISPLYTTYLCVATKV